MFLKMSPGAVRKIRSILIMGYFRNSLLKNPMLRRCDVGLANKRSWGSVFFSLKIQGGHKNEVENPGWSEK